MVSATDYHHLFLLCREDNRRQGPHPSMLVLILDPGNIRIYRNKNLRQKRLTDSRHIPCYSGRAHNWRTTELIDNGSEWVIRGPN
jgi:hypothetical protein